MDIEYELETPVESEDTEVDVNPDAQVDVVPELAVAGEPLQSATTALEWLVDLAYTIKQQGVSKSDIRTICTAMEHLQAKGLVPAECVSAEGYHPGLYTQERSLVNVNVSLEYIGERIVDVIKAIIKAVIDFAQLVSRRIKNFKHLNEIVKFRLANASEAAMLAAEACENIEKHIKLDVNRAAALKLYANELLIGTNRPRNKIALAAFNVSEPLKKLKYVETNAKLFTEQLAKGVTELVAWFTNNNGAPFNIPSNWAGGFENLAAILEDALTLNPDNDYLYDELKDTAFNFFTSKYEIEPLVLYEEIAESCLIATDQMRNIKKIKLENVNDLALSAANDFIKKAQLSLTSMDRMIELLNKVNSTQLAVLGLIYKYENKRYTLLMEELNESSVDDQIKVKAKQWHASLLSTLKRLVLG